MWQCAWDISGIPILANFVDYRISSDTVLNANWGDYACQNFFGN